MHGRSRSGTGEPSRWSTITVVTKRARGVALDLGHMMTTFEKDDPESPLETRLAHCRLCEMLGAVDVTEEPMIFGQAFHVACPGQVVTDLLE